jgi:hypothetical protein
MQKSDFLQKPAELAQSTQGSIEKLWKMGTEVSKLCAPLTSIFSSFFAVLFSAILQESEFSKAIYDLTLSRFNLLFPYDLSMERNIRPETEYFPTETVRPIISFLLDFSVARGFVPKLVAPSAQPQSKPMLFSPETALLEPETSEVFKKPTEETPNKSMFHLIADLQNGLESKLARSMKSVSSAFVERERQTIPLTSFAALVKPGLPLLTGPEGVASYRFAVLSEKETLDADLPSHPETEGFRSVPSGKKTTTEVAPVELTSGARIRAGVPTAVRNATELPVIISEREAPFLKLSTILSRVLSSGAAATFASSSRLSFDYPVTTSETSPPTPPLQGRVDLIPEEVPLPLASPIYGESELLRNTRVSLSAVAVAASRAERLINGTLTQPVSVTGVPQTHDIVAIEQGFGTAKFKEGVKHAGAEDFGLPSNLTSIVASYVRTNPVLFAKAGIGENYGKSFEAGSNPSSQHATTSETWKDKESYGLPIMLALAARSKNLIMPRLQHKLADFIGETQIAQSTNVGGIIGLSNSMPVRATMLGELATGATSSYAIENYVSRAPQAPSPEYRPRPVTPIIENALHLTLSEETLEDDLRDLERKINRILSEQLSRYYGSSRIQ